MKLRSLILSGLVVTMLAGIAYVGQTTDTSASKMATAANKLLASLTPEQKKQATFKFDSEERTNWFFVPLQDRKAGKALRKGLPLEDMTKEQRQLMVDLIAAGTSDRGKKETLTIMMLESILHDLEKGKGSVRDPDWYFVSIFGTPSKTGQWGWRFEGHHLSLNYTLNKGKVISATPAFFGANPAVVMSGEKKGLKTIPKSEQLALRLFNSLDKEQRKTAHQEKHFPEPRQGKVKAGVGEPVGIAASNLKPKQQKILTRLLQAYATRLPADIAQKQMQQVRKAGMDKIHFAFTGAGKANSPHTYRIYGPTFVVEFLNTQSDPAGNPANHIHSVWRQMGGDFGL